MPTVVACTWVHAQPLVSAAGAEAGAEAASPLIQLEPPPSKEVATRLVQFLRSLPARSRSLRAHAIAPSLVSSALQESQPLLDSGDLDNALVDEAGLLLPAVGSVLAAGGFGAALKDRWKARQDESSLRAGRDGALATLVQCEPDPRGTAAKAVLKRLCGGPDPGGDRAARPPLYLGAQRVPVSSVNTPIPAAEGISVQPDLSGVAAMASVGTVARRRLEDELARVSAERDYQIALRSADYFAYLDAANRSTRAAQSLLGGVLAFVRDVGIDMPSVAYDGLSLLDSAGDSPLDLLLGAADAPSYGLGGAAGAMHIACGAVELRHADAQRRRLGELDALVERNLSRIGIDGKRAERVGTPLARKVRSLFARNRRTAWARTWRRKGLAWLRIGYGLLSLGVSAAGVGMLLFIGAATVAGTGGLILLVASAAIGFSWLGITGYKLLSRAYGDSLRRAEQAALAKALELASQRGLAAPCLSDCTPAQLEALPRHCPALEGNRYLYAALLARRLMIDARDRNRGKAARVETATLLQALGMPRVWTTMLKRAPFEWVHRHIDAYLNDDMAMLALERGELQPWAAPEEAGPTKEAVPSPDRTDRGIAGWRDAPDRRAPTGGA